MFFDSQSSYVLRVWVVSSFWEFAGAWKGASLSRKPVDPRSHSDSHSQLQFSFHSFLLCYSIPMFARRAKRPKRLERRKRLMKRMVRIKLKKEWVQLGRVMMTNRKLNCKGFDVWCVLCTLITIACLCALLPAQTKWCESLRMYTVWATFLMWPQVLHLIWQIPWLRKFLGARRRPSTLIPKGFWQLASNPPNHRWQEPEESLRWKASRRLSRKARRRPVPRVPALKRTRKRPRPRPTTHGARRRSADTTARPRGSSWTSLGPKSRALLLFSLSMCSQLFFRECDCLYVASCFTLTCSLNWYEPGLNSKTREARQVNYLHVFARADTPHIQFMTWHQNWFLFCFGLLHQINFKSHR